MALSPEIIESIFRIRRDTAANWASVNPVLELAEPALETDTLKVKYGDGSTPWNTLPYSAGSAYAVDPDGTLAANSDARVATQKAVKTFVNAAITGILKFAGSTDCSTNPNYPAASKGASYVVTVAGKIGGASGKSVDVGDMYFATADNAGGTQAAVGASWDILEHNLVGALLAANNLSDLANAATARTNLGLDSPANYPTLNQNTTGSAAKLTTARTLAATGDVTWTGTFDGSADFSVTATIANGAVTLAKMANVATASVFYRKTAGVGAPEVQTLATLKTDLGLTGTNSGDQTSVSGNAGTATALQTARNIDGQSFNATADITVIAPGTHAATSKTTPVDGDEIPIVDSAASNVLKKLTWANLKATLKTYFDGLYVSRTSGTAFPGSPATGALFYRTDRNIEYYYDGTRWLSTQVFFVPIPNTDFLLPRVGTTNGMGRCANPWAGLYAVFVLDAIFHSYVDATSTWTLRAYYNDVTAQTTLATRSTAGDTANNHLSNRVAVNAVVASTVDNLQSDVTLVSGAANLYCSFGLTYRLIG